MSLHQANKDKPRAQKCRHFCFSFDTHNYCPTCREAGKGDDPCVTFEAPCHICTSLSDEQLQKIQNRKRYSKKQKAETSSKDELDLLGEGDGDSFNGSNADLESAADNLFTSPPRPQPLAFSSLSLKTPAKAVPPTPGTVLQNKIQRNLEKSLGDSLNIHIQQQMGSFQASMLEAFQSLREELAVKKSAEVDPSPHASKAGPSSKPAAHLDLPLPRSSTNTQSEAMDVDVGPALPPRLVLNQTSSDQYVAPSEAIPKDSSYSHKEQSHRQTVTPSSASDHLDEDSDESRIHPRPKKHSDKSKHKSRSRYVSSSEGDHSPVARHRSSKPSRAQPSGAASDQDLPQHDPDPPYYREVALSDIPSQYSEEVDTFRRILSLPDPRDSMPRSSTSVLGLDDEKGRQELRPRGPSSILPLSSVIKDAFDKFQHDFKAANLSEGKYVKPPPSTSKWYKVGQPTFQDKIQELNTDFAKICITPGAPVAKVPMPVLKELEHQARQNNSISPLPLPKPLLLAMLPWRSVNIASSQLSRRLNLRSRKVPILRKQQSADMRKLLSTWIFGTRLFLFNIELLPVSANR